MRADRLIALLMLLQSRGKMTAQALAEELEVSERTVYRDVDALSSAGIPIYGDPGPDGGYALLDSYRTTLTGLSENEVRALFMLSVPPPLVDLGVSDELKAALRKVAAALPATFSAGEAQIRRRFYLDPVWWDQSETPVPHLRTLHRAVTADQRLVITYRTWAGPALTRRVDPLALVAKAGAWYLVYAHSGPARVQQASNLLDVELLDEHFARPADFDLVRFWQAWCAGREERLYRVTLRVAPHFISALPHFIGDRACIASPQAGPTDAAGRITLDVAFRSLEEARERLLACGSGVEVLAPLALRCTLLDHAEQIVKLYGQADVERALAPNRFLP
ncbi:MAG: YafY family transcriptional regulator [Caldilineaceae bacterium]|nr:YafY family transcriptional regulator [Caldilineaceae bacterium]